MIISVSFVLPVLYREAKTKTTNINNSGQHGTVVQLLCILSDRTNIRKYKK